MAKKKPSGKTGKKNPAGKKPIRRPEPRKKQTIKQPVKKATKMAEETPLPVFETIQQAQEALAKKEITLGQFHDVQVKLNEGTPSAPPPQTEHPGAKMIRDNATRAKKMTMPTGTTEPKALKEPKAKKADAEYDKEAAKKICDMDCKKHYRMFLLAKMGLSRKQIAELLTTNMNVGQVGNALKLYADDPNLESEMANKIAEGKEKPKKKKDAATEAPAEPIAEQEQTETNAATAEQATAEQSPVEQTTPQA